MNRLQDKVAVITGGNSGIGEGIAKRFWEEGAKVVIFGRNKETLESFKQRYPTRVLAIAGDVTEKDDLQRLYDQTKNEFGRIDVLVANAGVGERLHVEEVTEEKFDYMVNINYRGAYFTVHYALPYLNDGSSIILMSSIGAAVTLKHHSVYASTKAATVKLAKNFANDLADRKIRVNSISPGYILTPIFDARLKKDPDYIDRRIPLIPLGRIGKPDDVANAALFLSTDEASYITGIDLTVDGGYTSSHPEP